MLWNPVEDPAMKLFLNPRGETGQSIEYRGSEPSPAAKKENKDKKGRKRRRERRGKEEEEAGARAGLPSRLGWSPPTS